MSKGATTLSPGRLIVLGDIVGTHGVRGLLRLHSGSDTAAALAAVRTVFVRASAGDEARPMDLLSARRHGRLTLVELAGITSIDEAEPFVGSVLAVPESDLPAPGPGEFYAFQLEGLEVRTVQGDRLGTVASVLPTGSNDVLVVRDGAREHLIPVIADVIRAVDLAAGRVVIHPIDGLLD